jgi:uncharacterized protein
MISQIFVKINNWIIKKTTKHLKPSEIAIIGPKCIQNNECRELVTNDINNCKKCGKCSVKDLLEIKQKFNLKDIHIVTGGSLAREFVKQAKVKVVIAVACEREIALGMIGVLPHKSYGIFIEKPFGPCKNTFVDKDKIEQAIQSFLK